MLLVDEINSSIKALATAPDVVARLFSSSNDTTKTYAWDADSWLYPIRDLVNCRAVYNNWLGRRDGPTLIDVDGDKRFAVNCWHYKPGSLIGRKVWYLDEDGTTVHERTIIDQRRIGETDLRILMFDTALPASVYAAKALPADAINKVGNWNGVPCFSSLVSNANMVRRGITRAFNSVIGASVVNTTDTDLAWLSETPTTGASGSPLFLLIDGELVLLWTWSSVFSGTQLRVYANDVNTAMTDMAGSTREIEIIDLSSYDNVTPQSGPEPLPEGFLDMPISTSNVLDTTILDNGQDVTAPLELYDPMFTSDRDTFIVARAELANLDNGQATFTMRVLVNSIPRAEATGITVKQSGEVLGIASHPFAVQKDDTVQITLESTNGDDDDVNITVVLVDVQYTSAISEGVEQTISKITEGAV